MSQELCLLRINVSPYMVELVDHSGDGTDYHVYCALMDEATGKPAEYALRAGTTLPEALRFVAEAIELASKITDVQSWTPGSVLQGASSMLRMRMIPNKEKTNDDVCSLSMRPIDGESTKPGHELAAKPAL